MHARDEVRFVLQPSNFGGVGVFAVEEIPAGVEVFAEPYHPRRAHLESIPIALRKYCIHLSDEECLRPERFDRMEIWWYLNHSATPNLAREVGDRLVTRRSIAAGEELLIDYNLLDEPKHLKEDYYR